MTERFATPPGQQGQFAWSPDTVDLAGTPTPSVAFGLTRGYRDPTRRVAWEPYSRRKQHWRSRDETQASVFAALEAGLHHFGGVPSVILHDYICTN